MPVGLPTTMGKNPLTNPFPLGITTVASAGTAVQLTHNFTDIQNRAEHAVEIRAQDANTGLIYVLVVQGGPPFLLPNGSTVTGADTVNFLNVVRVLAAKEVYDMPVWMMNTLLLGNIWIDASVSAQSVLASFHEA